MKNTKSTSTKTEEKASTKQSSTKSKAAKTKTDMKSAFDILLETQTKFVDSFFDNSQKFAETFKANESVENTRKFVNEMLEKQQSTLETSVESIKKQFKFEEAPDFVKEVVEANQEFGKKWFEALRATVKAKDAKELNDILMANVKKAQENLKEVNTLLTESFSKPADVQEVFSPDYAKGIAKKVVAMYEPA